jgi:hypothetical protein
MTRVTQVSSYACSVANDAMTQHDRFSSIERHARTQTGEIANCRHNVSMRHPSPECRSTIPWRGFRSSRNGRLVNAPGTIARSLPSTRFTAASLRGVSATARSHAGVTASTRCSRVKALCSQAIWWLVSRSRPTKVHAPAGAVAISKRPLPLPRVTGRENFRKFRTF